MSQLDYALLNYNGGTGNGSPSTMAEFLCDYNTFSCVKKWINKYSRGQDINYRTMVNHMVILFNQFTFESVECILKGTVHEHQVCLVNSLFAFFLGRDSYGEGIDDVFMGKLKKEIIK